MIINASISSLVRNSPIRADSSAILEFKIIKIKVATTTLKIKKLRANTAFCFGASVYEFYKFIQKYTKMTPNLKNFVKEQDFKSVILK
jgi:hypothetical protein